MVTTGDVIVAFNPLMDFSSVNLSIGIEYIVEEFLPGEVGMMQMVVVRDDRGIPGIFDLARFKSKDFYTCYMEKLNA